MRGKVHRGGDRNRRRRITPAYAGKRSIAYTVISARQDHPRLCGEKFLVYTGLYPTRGSPPPMRGKVVCKSHLANGIRITPAYAGKRHSDRRPSRFCRDHPRLCGEKADTQISGKTVEGSPPPMRGKVSDDLRRNIRIGITPAYAGKSRILRMKQCVVRDHPRLCGEKHNLLPQNRINHRITPAYAGKSLTARRKAAFRKDHPRLCGEKKIGEGVIP